MYEWECHGILEAMKRMNCFSAEFTVIALNVDNFNTQQMVNEDRQTAKGNLSKFLAKVHENDAFFYEV